MPTTSLRFLSTVLKLLGILYITLGNQLCMNCNPTVQLLIVISQVVNFLPSWQRATTAIHGYSAYRICERQKEKHISLASSSHQRHITLYLCKKANLNLTGCY